MRVKVLKYCRYEMNEMKVKVSDSLDNVPNENVVTQQVTDRLTDQLLELLEWLLATNKFLRVPLQYL